MDGAVLNLSKRARAFSDQASLDSVVVGVVVAAETAPAPNRSFRFWRRSSAFEVGALSGTTNPKRSARFLSASFCCSSVSLLPLLAVMEALEDLLMATATAVAVLATAGVLCQTFWPAVPIALVQSAG